MEVRTPNGETVIFASYEDGASSASWPTHLSPSDFFRRLSPYMVLPDELHYWAGSNPQTVRTRDLFFSGTDDVDKADILTAEDRDSDAKYGWERSFIDPATTSGGILTEHGSLPGPLLVTFLDRTGSGTVPEYSKDLETLYSKNGNRH